MKAMHFNCRKCGECRKSIVHIAIARKYWTSEVCVEYSIVQRCMLLFKNGNNIMCALSMCVCVCVCHKR